MPRLILIIMLSLTLSCCGEIDSPPPQSAVPEATNIAIADLRKLVDGRNVYIEESLIVGGYITSNDKASNFYKTFIIEDATSAIEVMAGLYDLHNIYPEGYYVTLKLKDCYIATHFGVLQVGRKAESYSNYPTEYFASRVLLDRHVTRYDVRNPISPKPYAIKDLQQADCGRLVSIGALHNVNDKYKEIFNLNEDGEWSGYNLFADDNGNMIAVYTSNYASYANDKLPNTKVAITGILQYGKLGSQEMFMIKMRDKNDCKSVN